MNERLKKIILDKLYNDMKGSEIIVDDGNIWAIDPNEKYWYFQLNKNGTLYWRWDFFNNFFRLFSIERKEYEPLIRDMVGDILNHKVDTSQRFSLFSNKVEDILNRKVDTSYVRGEELLGAVEEIFNRKVKTTVFDEVPPEGLVERILNRKVKTSWGNRLIQSKWVEDILNRKVNKI